MYAFAQYLTCSSTPMPNNEGNKRQTHSLKHAQKSIKTLHAENGKRMLYKAITAAKLVPDQANSGPFGASSMFENKT